MCKGNTTGTAEPTVYIENERVRVTEWRFKNKGDNTGWHTHEYDYVVVPLFNGYLDIDLPDGTRTQAELKNGVPYFRNVGVQHDVINANDFECVFMEVEILN